LWALVRLFRLTHAQAAKVQTLELTTAWTARAAAAQAPSATFVPIWEGEEATAGRWWMTFNRGTYVHDLLAMCGAANVFADRERRYPLAADVAGAPAEERAGRDTRYPRVTSEEVLQRSPELILLPSEPYAFGETDALRMAKSLRGTPATDLGRIRTVDGSLLTWHGTRLGRALVELPALIRPVEEL
jgi:ABC-type Fe3+-hydroxamate transport system substrate-binding protein